MQKRPELKATYSGIQPKCAQPKQNDQVSNQISEDAKAEIAAKKELRRQKEKELINGVLKNPLSVGARNLARASNIFTKNKVNKIRIDKFSNAKDLLKQQKPRLGRGLNPGDVVIQYKSRV